MNESFTLYFSPGACSRVAMMALEQCAAEYEAKAVRLPKREHQEAWYKALNPKGKVPLLLTPEGSLTETLAIVSYLQQVTPQASLLPQDGALSVAQVQAWLAWCGTTLHPLIYRLRMTARIHPDQAIHTEIRQAALLELCEQLQVAESVLDDGRRWLCGDNWTIADTYLLWVWQRARDAGCEAGEWPALVAWEQRNITLPAWQRVLDREASIA